MGEKTSKKKKTQRRLASHELQRPSPLRRPGLGAGARFKSDARVTIVSNGAPSNLTQGWPTNHTQAKAPKAFHDHSSSAGSQQQSGSRSWRWCRNAQSRRKIFWLSRDLVSLPQCLLRSLSRFPALSLSEAPIILCLLEFRARQCCAVYLWTHLSLFCLLCSCVFFSEPLMDLECTRTNQPSRPSPPSWGSSPLPTTSAPAWSFLSPSEWVMILLLFGSIIGSMSSLASILLKKLNPL